MFSHPPYFGSMVQIVNYMRYDLEERVVFSGKSLTKTTKTPPVSGSDTRKPVFTYWYISESNPTDRPHWPSAR